MTRARSDLLAAAGLAVFVALLFCLAYGRLRPETWALPTSYGGDAWFVLAYLKAAQDGHVVPLRTLEIPELNAPFAASWNDFLRQHKPQFAVAGLLTRGLGLFPTANLLLLFAHVLAALSFYLVARSLRCRREWALAGAALFALSPFLFWRSLGHLTLTMCWTIPLCILVVSWSFSRRGLPAGSRWFWLGLAVAALQGLHNIYFSGLFAQFLVLAAAAQAVRRRGLRKAAGPLLLLLALGLVTAADNANMLAAERREGPNPEAARRPYGNLERFALKPIELILPTPGSGLLGWGTLAMPYWNGTLYRGERGSAYLGLAGIAGLAWLALAGARGFFLKRRGASPPALVAVLWIILYSVVGGGNGLLGVFGFVFFRGTSRYSAWILALVLLALVSRLSRASLRWPRAASAFAAAALTAIGLADQMPRFAPAAALEPAKAMVESDRRFVESLETSLPEGAMLFLLPVMETPEGQAVLKVTEYEHYRPYLFSSRLRFSDGVDKGRPREDWQHRLIDAAPEALVSTLERHGFSGLIVNRKGFDQAAQALLDALAAASRPLSIESADGQLVFVPLPPAAPQERPG